MTHAAAGRPGAQVECETVPRVDRHELLGVSCCGRATWLINEAAAEVLTKITATDGRPLFTDEAVFGDLSGYTVYVRENFRAESSQDSNFATDQVALRVSRREDGILTQTGRMLRFA